MSVEINYMGDYSEARQEVSSLCQRAVQNKKHFTGFYIIRKLQEKADH